MLKAQAEAANHAMNETPKPTTPVAAPAKAPKKHEFVKLPEYKVPKRLARYRKEFEHWNFDQIPEESQYRIKKQVKEDGKKMKNMELFYNPQRERFYIHDRFSNYYLAYDKDWWDEYPTRQLTLQELSQRPKKPKQAAPVNATPATPVPAEKPKEAPVPAKPAPVPPEKANKPMNETPKPSAPTVQAPKRTPLQVVSASTIKQRNLEQLFKWLQLDFRLIQLIKLRKELHCKSFRLIQ